MKNYKPVVRYSLKLMLKFSFATISLIALYVLCAVVLSIVPYNTNFQQAREGLSIYILSNGIHTDLVLPAKNEYKDWTRILALEHTLSKDSSISYIAFGWGNRGFYLETPHVSDIKYATVFKAMFALDASAMHITKYNHLEETDACKKISISKEHYKKLVEYIDSAFLKNTQGDPMYIKDYHYGNNDSFYEATGSYSLFYTCNSWANEGLRCSGIRSCLWTPFDKGIFLHF